MNYLLDFMRSCDYDIDLMMTRGDEFKKTLESEAEKLAQKKVEELLDARREKYQLEV